MAAPCFRACLAGEPSPARATDGSGASPAAGRPSAIAPTARPRPFEAAHLAAVLATQPRGRGRRFEFDDIALYRGSLPPTGSQREP